MKDLTISGFLIRAMWQNEHIMSFLIESCYLCYLVVIYKLLYLNTHLPNLYVEKLKFIEGSQLAQVSGKISRADTISAAPTGLSLPGRKWQQKEVVAPYSIYATLPDL
jgi:hypothetical protein